MYCVLIHVCVCVMVGGGSIWVPHIFKVDVQMLKSPPSTVSHNHQVRVKGRGPCLHQYGNKLLCQGVWSPLCIKGIWPCINVGGLGASLSLSWPSKLHAQIRVWYVFWGDLLFHPFLSEVHSYNRP